MVRCRNIVVLLILVLLFVSGDASARFVSEIIIKS